MTLFFPNKADQSANQNWGDYIKDFDKQKRISVKLSQYITMLVQDN